MEQATVSSTDSPSGRTGDRSDGGVFISYSRHDQEFVRQLHEALTRERVGTWVDWESIPPSWDWLQEIYAGIEGAQVFVFVITPRSVTSSVCRQELDHAVSNNKRVVPILRERTDAALIPSSLARLNWVMMSDADDLGAGVAALTDALRRDPDWVRMHTHVLQRAVEWEAKGRDKSLLLRGANLRLAEEWLNGAPGKDPAPTQMQQALLSASRTGESRRQRAILGAVVFGMVVACALAIIALLSRSDAIAQRSQAVLQGRIAESRGIAAEAESQALTDPDLALTLAVAGDRIEDTPQAEDALRQALANAHLVAILGGPKENTEAAAFDRGGGYVATVSEDDAVRVWSAESGRLLKVLGHPDPSLAGNQCGGGVVDFNPDGSHLVALLPCDTEATVWDWKRRQIIAAFPGLDSAAFSPNGRLLVTGDTDGTAVIWNWRRYTSLQTLHVSGRSVTSAAFSRNGDYVLTVTDRGPPTIWDWRRGARLASLGTKRESVESAEFSGDGRYIVLTRPFGAEIWDWRRKARVWRAGGLGSPNLVFSAAISQNGAFVATTGADDAATVLDWRSGRVVTRLVGHTAQIEGESFSPDGQYALTVAADGTARIWQLRSVVPWLTVRVYSPHAIGDRYEVNPDSDTAEVVRDVAFSPDSRYMAATLSDRTVRVYNLATRRPVTNLRSGAPGVGAVSFSPDGRYLLTIPPNGDGARIWNWQQGRVVTRLPYSPGGEIGRHGNYVIPGSSWATIIVNWHTGYSLADLPDPTAEGTLVIGTSAHFSPDGQLVAIGYAAGQLVRIWDPRRSRVLATIRGPQVAVGTLQAPADVAFSPNGKFLEVGTPGGGIDIWNWRTMRVVSVLAGSANSASAAFGGPGRGYLIAATTGGVARIWDWSTGQPFMTSIGHSGQVRVTAFSPNGKYFVTVGDDNLAQVQTCDVCVSGPQLMRMALSRVTRSLSPQERAAYLP